MPNSATIDVTATETLALRQDGDVILLTNHIRQQAQSAGMSMLDQTKLSTAASELARNMLVHGGGGNAQLDRVCQGGRTGIRLTFADRGPGIADVDLAMQDGYSTGAGMGMGLPGAKRLTDAFEIVSAVGEGTTVTILLWAND